MRQDDTKRQAQTENITNTSPEVKRTKEIPFKSLNETKELSCSSPANDSIYFKVVHSKDEFLQFQSLNLENSFHPTFTHQIFNNQIISGYKNVKILVSLTPKRLFPHFKIVYDRALSYKDNIEELLRKHFALVYTTNEDDFIKNLEAERDIKPQGRLLKTEKTDKGDTREIYFIDILKDHYEVFNWNYQYLLTFFIDGASFIPIEEDFWYYIVVIERSASIPGSNKEGFDWKTIGFCSYKNFHMALDRYNSMISQFLILQPYQRKGYGNLLLENIYTYLIDIGEECVEITTEDPANEFILMRDYTLIKMVLDKGWIDTYIKLLDTSNEINTKEVYDAFKLGTEDLNRITQGLKLQKNLIQRMFDIIALALVSNEFKPMLIKEKKEKMGLSLKEDYSDSLFKDKKYGPFISFHDEEDYDVEKEIEEEKACFNQEITIKEKTEMVYNLYEQDVNKIVCKVTKLLLDYKQKMK